MATEMLQYLDPDGLDETVLNIGQIKTSLEGQISDLEDSIEEEMQNLPYARPDGIYPDMTVGAVIGADETAQWAQRESTGSGAATVRSVQGAAVAFNQLNDNDKPTSVSYGLTATNNGDGSWTLNGTPTAQAGIDIFSNRLFLANHKYLVKGCPAGGNSATYFFYFLQSGVDYGSGGFKTPTTDTTGQLRFIAKVGTSFDNVTVWPQVFDLTAMFGSGNEPQTVAEFEQMYPEAYYPYSAPTLKPVQIAGIASTDAQGGELDSVEWPTQTLRAAGSVADMLYADHVDVRVGSAVIDENTSIWVSSSSGTYVRFGISTILNAIGKIEADAAMWVASLQTLDVTPNAICSAATPNRVYFTLTENETTVELAKQYLAAHPIHIFYPLATPTTTPISPALPMTYKVQQGGSESVIVSDGEVSAAPVLTVAEPVNMSTELTRIWEAIQSLGYTRNAAQLSRPVSLTDIGSIDETQKDTTEIAEIDTTKEVQE